MRTRVATLEGGSARTGKSPGGDGRGVHARPRREAAFRVRRPPVRRVHMPGDRRRRDEGDPRSRLRLFVAGCVIMAILVLIRLWYLQILDQTSYEEASTQNKLRIAHIEAPRGRILGSDGSVLVDNTLALQVGIDLSQVPSDQQDRLVSRLARILGMTEEEVWSRIERPKDPNVVALPIAEVDKETMMFIKERQEEFPGVVPVVTAKRIYTQTDCEPGVEECHTLAPHVLGYVGETTAEDLEEHEDYHMGDSIGRAGLEASYEQDLRGEAGERRYLVNSKGRQIGRPLDETAPVQGHDIVSTVDPRVQEIAEQALEEGIDAARRRVDRGNTEKPFEATGGAVVVMDPRDGSIRAMASYPDYDPSEFVDGIPQERWAWLNDPRNQYPLTNRAIAGLYAPASTFKVVTATAGLQWGFITRDTIVNAGPYFVAGREKRKFRDWKPSGHGRTDLRKSIVQSVDVYYYMLGNEMYERRGERWFLQETARSLGLGARTGVDIPGERAGRVPDEDWKRRVNNENPTAFPDPLWYPGDSINMSIGQGDLIVTPLQMAAVYGAIANGGTVWKPRSVDRVQSQTGAPIRQVPPEQIGALPIPPEDISVLKEALFGVTTEGTARVAFDGYPMERVAIAGKTGTGEVAGKQDTAWFVSFAPVENPEYVVAVVVEQGGHGGDTAAPIARLIYERIYDLPSQGLVQGAVTD